MSLTNLFNYIKLFFNKYLYYNKLYIKYYLIFQLKVIWIFTETFLGYAIYLFCIFYGVSGLSSQNNEALKACCIIFAIYVAGSVVQWYILVKIPSTKKFLENFIGKNVIISHLGDYVGSRAVVKGVMTLGPFVGIATAEIVTKQQNLLENFSKSDAHLKRTLDTYKDANITVDKKTLDRILTEANALANAPTKGVVTRAIETEMFTKRIDSISKVFRKN